MESSDSIYLIRPWIFAVRNLQVQFYSPGYLCSLERCHWWVKNSNVFVWGPGNVGNGRLNVKDMFLRRTRSCGILTTIVFPFTALEHLVPFPIYLKWKFKLFSKMSTIALLLLVHVLVEVNAYACSTINAFPLESFLQIGSIYYIYISSERSDIMNYRSICVLHHVGNFFEPLITKDLFSSQGALQYKSAQVLQERFCYN